MRELGTLGGNWDTGRAWGHWDGGCWEGSRTLGRDGGTRKGQGHQDETGDTGMGMGTLGGDWDSGRGWGHRNKTGDTGVADTRRGLGALGGNWDGGHQQGTGDTGRELGHREEMGT